MEKHWCYFLFLVWFSYLIITQVLLFKNGFLLTRESQLKNSSCESYINISCTEEHTHCSKDDNKNIRKQLDDVSTTCWRQKNRVLLIIIDALKYDFALFNDSNHDPKPYENNLPIINSLLKSKPNRTRLYKFIADPPTTTMQRIKGITTGSLPTFIDAGSNFASNEITEDNLIDQINNQGYKSVFMGDETWSSLFPNRFVRNYPFPSFDVWDLDTVDNGVLNHLFPEMRNKDWKFLIAHFLGVDHCGHRYGPDHPEMKRKLGEMNNVIRKVVNDMEDDMTLFVIGDHGMTTTGDHGGESESEVTAAMFIYSKLNLQPSFYDNNNTVKQVDLVPTLATILGIPIPFSNLGGIIHDVLPLKIEFNNMLFATWSNVEQLIQFIKEYNLKTNIFEPEFFSKIETTYIALQLKVKTINSGLQFKEFAEEANNFIRHIREMCEELWIQFDPFSMARGLLILSHIIIFVYIILEGLTSEKLAEIVRIKFVSICFVSVIISAFISALIVYIELQNSLTETIYFSSGLLGICLLGIIIISNFQEISLKLNENSKNRKLTDIASRILLTFSSLMLFSNSFIVEEAKIMLFFILSLLLILLGSFGFLQLPYSKKVLTKTTSKSKAVIFSVTICVLLKISTVYWKCREEVLCNDYISSKRDFSRTDWILSVAFLAIFVAASRTWLRSCGNLNGFSPTVLLAKYTPTVILICSVGFWILHKLPTNTKIKLFGTIQPDILARAALALIIINFVSIFLKPLCVFYLKNKRIEVDMRSSNVIPQLAKHVFIKSDDTQKPPIVYGLATVYSSTFIILIINIVLFWCLLLGEVIVPSCISIIFVVSLLIAIISIYRHEKAQTIDDLFEVPIIATLMWFVLSIYLFYCTGHQPSFTNISWDAAFVGTSGLLDYTLIPAFMVYIHTFGSYILMGISLPLLTTAPFSLYLMVPYLIKKKKFDLSRGEMILYENHSIVFRNIFKTSLVYVLIHTLRVFSSMLAATIHCRHLMVWNIFAPKFIFESIGLFTTLWSVGVGYLLFIIIHTKVNSFIVELQKQMS